MSTVIAREANTDVNTFPKGFDPQRFPILAAHWFGAGARAAPARLSAEVVDLDRMRLAAALHRLGQTIGADVGSRNDMLRRLAPRVREAPQ